MTFIDGILIVMVRCFLQKALVDVLNPGGVMKQLWLAIVPFVLLACSSPNALHTSGTTDRLVTKEIAALLNFEWVKRHVG